MGFTKIRWLVLGGVAVYGGVGLSFWLWQTRLIFFPSALLKETPAEYGLIYEEVWIAVESDRPAHPPERLHGWWIPAAIEAPALLHLHGNGSNIGDLVGDAKRFHRLGLSVLMIDYRGYGRSEGGFPSEVSVYDDAMAAWNYLTDVQQIPPERIFLYGQSLGGAIAIELATHKPEVAGVIVESSFTSIEGMVDFISPYRLLPIDWLLTQRFDSLSKVRSLQSPILFIHGTADRTVPAWMSRSLYAATTAPKALLLVPHAGHNNIAEIGGEMYWQAIEDFIERSK
jgi:hypothetical protein